MDRQQPIEELRGNRRTLSLPKRRMSLATQQLSSLVTPPPQGDSDINHEDRDRASHPAMHGIVRFTTYLDGELIVGMEPEIGYLHRGFEKESENSKWIQVVPYTDRLNYVSPFKQHWILDGGGEALRN